MPGGGETCLGNRHCPRPSDHLASVMAAFDLQTWAADVEDENSLGNLPKASHIRPSAQAPLNEHAEAAKRTAEPDACRHQRPYEQGLGGASCSPDKAKACL